MKAKKALYSAAVAALTLVAAPPASAINLIADYSDSSVSGGIWQSSGGQLFSADPGGGAFNVTDIFKTNIAVAMSYLNNSVKAGRNLTVTFKLHDFTGQGADGDSQITSVYSDTGLPASSIIRLDSSAGSHFYVDPTPLSSSEWNMNFDNATLGGGTVNVGRYGSASASSAAADRTDILTLAMHELIHSAGLKPDTPANSANPKLTIPGTLTGFADFDLPFITTSSHIDPFAQGGVFAHTVTSEPSFGNNDRWLLTGVEIYGLCVIHGCLSSEVNTNLVSSIPEPGSMAMFAAGLGLVVGIGWRRQRRV